MVVQPYFSRNFIRIKCNPASNRLMSKKKYSNNINDLKISLYNRIMCTFLIIHLDTKRLSRNGLECRVKRLTAFEPELEGEGLHCFSA